MYAVNLPLLNCKDKALATRLSQSDISLDGLTDNHVTGKIFEVDGLPNYLRYETRLACLRHSAIKGSMSVLST